MVKHRTIDASRSLAMRIKRWLAKGCDTARVIRSCSRFTSIPVFGVKGSPYIELTATVVE